MHYIEANRRESNYHLANLLSYRDVKEGFDRKPTTIDVSESEKNRAKRQDAKVH